MSRIDEAMRRAGRGTRPDLTLEEGPARSHAEPETPWDVEATRPAAPAHTRPVAVPLREPGPEPAARGPVSTEPATLALFKGFHPAVQERIVAGESASASLMEQYRQLAATLHHTQVAHGIKLVLVASAAAGEGKTLTATNLALTLSESYRRRVLLIDADLRRPSLHDVFQVPNVAGLNEGLLAPSESKLALLQITPCLTLLTAGRPNPDPMSSLTSPRMRQILEEAAARFDWVLVDTPPVTLMADANLLGAMAHAVLLVVRAGRTPYESIEKAIGTLGRDKILGVVLNGTEDTSAQHDYYGYRY